MAEIKMKCSICGHVYDPKRGDVGVDKGMDFSDVPADWKCPVCGAAKSAFFKID